MRDMFAVFAGLFVLVGCFVQPEGFLFTAVFASLAILAHWHEDSPYA